MAMLLGAGKVLKANEASLNGTVRLIFQPAEEGGAGAKKMIEEGTLPACTMSAITTQTSSSLTLALAAVLLIVYHSFSVHQATCSAPRSDGHGDNKAEPHDQDAISNVFLPHSGHPLLSCYQH